MVIETTGVANPAPIIQTFFLDPDMASSVRLDGIVTLVDAKHVGRHLDEQVCGGSRQSCLSDKGTAPLAVGVTALGSLTGLQGHQMGPIPW